MPLINPGRNSRMFFSCSPAASSGGRIALKRSTGARKHFAVDVHCHVLTPAAEELVRPYFRTDYEPAYVFSNDATREVNRKQAENVQVKLTSVAERLKIMDKLGIDIQAISTAPNQYYYWADPEIGQQTARIINENIAATVAANPDRFVGLGTVPLQEPEMAVAELERLVTKLGLRGIEMGGNVRGVDLSDERFRPFFAKAEELGILIFIHPHGFTHGQRLNDHYLINVIGNPLDSTVAVHHLILGGVLDSYPRLKIVVAHGGGFLPAYSGRIDPAHAARPDLRRCIKKKPTSYLRKLYFDTIVFTPHQLEYLVKQYGSDHIVLGTDYPYDMAESDPIGFIDSATRLTRDEKAAIMGRNAARLLTVRIPPPPKKKAAATPARKKP